MLAWGEQLLASVQKGIESCESNFQISPIIIQRFQPINDTPLLEDHFLLERYKVSGLTKRIGDADLQKAKMREEFMVSFTGKIAKLDKIKRSADDIFVFSSLPDDVNIEQFWSMILNHNVENIIMIVQKNEKKTKTMKPVKIFKTVKLDDSDTHPLVETICSLLDKVKVEEGQPVLLIGSKGKGFSVCGAVSVCLHSVRAIERETTFSLLEYATLLKRIEDDFIKVFVSY
ncbi:unnamed protein product [Mytilus edulis]|uniref:Tyrosine-protein phosphatase domain-containing protein n=1 Tax=Mytilus edulis TaxID=6550 RepID=A0A8S3U7N7_MYTED|nr:unnamed protein product [Mytilus edulis]